VSKGVTRDMTVRAKEQLEKQQRIVERLTKKVDDMDRELRDLRVDLHNEEQILSYYQAHPALQDNPDVDVVFPLPGFEDEVSIQDRVEVNK
jgi:hypothetical protein